MRPSPCGSHETEVGNSVNRQRDHFEHAMQQRERGGEKDSVDRERRLPILRLMESIGGGAGENAVDDTGIGSKPGIISAFFDFEKEKPKSYDDDDDEHARDVLQRISLRHQRVPNLYRALSWHPSYLDCFDQMMDTLMWAEGPLLVPFRHFLAIVASSRHRCRYLVATHLKHFVESGGDTTWVEGIARTSERAKKILHINALLAHQPWMVRSKHIKEIITGKHPWGISELVHALVILCMFHALSGVSFGLGILPEADIARIFFTCASEGGLANREVSSFPVLSRGRLLNFSRSESPSKVDDNASDSINNGFDGDDMESQTRASFSSLVGLEVARLNSSKSNDVIHRVANSVSKSEGNSSAIDTLSSSTATATENPLRVASSAMSDSAAFAPNLESERQLRDVLTRDVSELRKMKKAEPLDKAFESAATVGNETLSSSHPDSSLSIGSRSVDVKEKSSHEARRAATKVTVSMTSEGSEKSHKTISDRQRFQGDHPMQYVEFFTAMKVQPDVSVLRIQDYSWTHDGYAIVSRFYPASSDLIDRVFQTIYALTYNTLGSYEDVDTEPLRQAVWYYAQSCFGVRNDDFDYRQVNVVLDKPLKVFVKKIVCHPETITRDDWDFSDALTPAERCHIALIAACARSQAALIYALRAVHKTMM